MGALAHPSRRRPSRASGDPSQASGGPSRGSGDPSQASGGPSRASGDPSQASGGPSRGSGDPSQASGGPSRGSGDPSRGSGGPSRSALRPLVAIVLAALLAALLVGYRPSLAPPGLHSRNVALGAAQAEVLVDTRASQLATATPANPNAGKLVAELAVGYALYLQSDHATAALGEALGLHGLSVSASGPFTLLLGRENLGPKLPTPPNPILVDNAYRLLLDVRRRTPDAEHLRTGAFGARRGGAGGCRACAAAAPRARRTIGRPGRPGNGGGAPARADHRWAGGGRGSLAGDGVRVRACAVDRPQLPLRAPPSAPACSPYRRRARGARPARRAAPARRRLAAHHARAAVGAGRLHGDAVPRPLRRDPAAGQPAAQQHAGPAAADGARAAVAAEPRAGQRRGPPAREAHARALRSACLPRSVLCRICAERPGAGEHG